MKKVLFRGPALTQSGYGVHSRQVISWLLTKPIDLHVQVLPWGDTPWYVNPDALDGLVGKIMACTKPYEGVFDTTFQLQLPNEWDPKLGIENIGITAAVESDKCNPEWINACMNMKQVVVPSEHAKKSLASFSNVCVIPEAYSHECTLHADQLPKLPMFETDFNFLLFGQLTGDNPFNDRKNTFFTLKWLLEEFKDDQNIGIVLKTNYGRNSLIDKNKVVETITNLVKECRKGPFPKIHILHGDMSPVEVAALYKHPQIKALVSLTRGEGFGLPLLEAAASDLPIIATDWSAHTEFLRKGKYIPVYYTLENVHKSRVDNKIFIPDSRWANVSEKDFKKKVSKFRSSNDIPKEWAIQLGKTIRDEYSLDVITKIYDERFGDLL